MARDDRPREFLEPAAELGSWPLVATMVLVTVALASAGGWPGVLGFATGPLALALILRGQRGRRRGVRLEDDGLTELRWFAPDRFVPWTSLREVMRGADGVRLETDAGPLIFAPSCRYGRVVALHAQQALATEPPPPPLGDDALERLLGGSSIAAGRLLPRWLGRGRLRLLALAGWMLIVALLLWNALAYGFGPMGLRWAAVALAPILAWAAWRRPSWELTPFAVTADARGLRLELATGQRFLPWAEVAALNSDFASQASLTSLRGEYRVPVGGDRDELLQAVAAVLAARDQGAVLPRLEGAGDAALSRADQVTAASPERGLSRAE